MSAFQPWVSERAKLSERALPMRKLAARFEALSDASRARARFGPQTARLPRPRP